jgi:hypothetical protein
MNNYNKGDLVWIPQATLGFIKTTASNNPMQVGELESLLPNYHTKKANYGIVLKSSHKDFVKVAFRENLDMQLLFRTTDLRKPNTEGNYGKTY